MMKGLKEQKRKGKEGEERKQRKTYMKKKGRETKGNEEDTEGGAKEKSK